jgi:hypothetical protein
MLTLYSKKMNLNLVSRIWDNFMLDGEIFAIKTALAILKYRENQLINQPYNKIITFLRGGGNSLKDSFTGGRLDMTFLDEDKLFKVIENIDIDH